MDDRELAIFLLGSVEELYLRTRVQQALLDRLVTQDVDWRAKAERAEILNAPAYRPLFDKLRADMFGLERATRPPKDWRAIVRKLLDEGDS
jgi:hypothetical protein